MTDFASLLQPDRGQKARLIHLVDKDSAAEWIGRQSGERRMLLDSVRFDGKTPFQFVIFPAGDDAFEIAATVTSAASLSPWCLAKLAEALPEGAYRLAAGEPGPAMLGWLLAQHRFDRYRSTPPARPGPRVLVTGEAGRIEAAVSHAQSVALVRDLVDTPAADMGPAELESAVRQEAEAFCAQMAVTCGDALEQGYPLIATVGRGAVRERSPRLIELEWGDQRHPRIAIVGKGVCFDSGGLDIKPSSAMRLMKKDMGGAAHALALARLIMDLNLPVRLHLLIPAVENSVSGASFRPGDILKSRQGLMVEVDNTDAEGRLVLADALTRAGEQKPELIVDFATLTGAARVALGPDLPALFCNDEPLAQQLRATAEAADDPLWRMPLWDGYEEMLKSDIADLGNAADSPHAGAITAALFLRRFIPADTPWAHLDVFAWRPAAKPGRPKGADAQGLRAVFATLQERFSMA